MHCLAIVSGNCGVTDRLFVYCAAIRDEGGMSYTGAALNNTHNAHCIAGAGGNMHTDCLVHTVTTQLKQSLSRYTEHVHLDGETNRVDLHLSSSGT